jgi:hypothetical protein
VIYVFVCVDRADALHKFIYTQREIYTYVYIFVWVYTYNCWKIYLHHFTLLLNIPTMPELIITASWKPPSLPEFIPPKVNRQSRRGLSLPVW